MCKTIKKNIFVSYKGKDLPRVIIWNTRDYKGILYDGYKKVGSVWADPSSEPEAEEELFRFHSLKHKRTFYEEGRGMKQLFSVIRESFMAASAEYERTYGKYARVLGFGS